MLIQMLVHQPQMLGPVLMHTPTWVWGLLATLTALGLSQAPALHPGHQVEHEEAAQRAGGDDAALAGEALGQAPRPPGAQ